MDTASVQAVAPRVVGHGEQFPVSFAPLAGRVAVYGHGTLDADAAVFGHGTQASAVNNSARRGYEAYGAGQETTPPSLAVRKAHVIRGIGEVRVKEKEAQTELSQALHDLKQLVIKKVGEDRGQALQGEYDSQYYDIDVELKTGEIKLIRKADQSIIRIDTERLTTDDPDSADTEIILSLEKLRALAWHNDLYEGGGYFSGREYIEDGEVVLGSRRGANGFEVLKRNFTDKEKEAFAYENADQLIADIDMVCGEDEELFCMVEDLHSYYYKAIEGDIAVLEGGLYGLTLAEREEVEEEVEEKIEKLRKLQTSRELMLLAYIRGLEFQLDTAEREITLEEKENILLKKVEEYFSSHRNFGKGASSAIKYKAFAAFMVATALYSKEEESKRYEAVDYQDLVGEEYHFTNKDKYRALLKRRGIYAAMRTGIIGAIARGYDKTRRVIENGIEAREVSRERIEAREEEGVAAIEGDVEIDQRWFDWHSAYAKLDIEYDSEEDASKAFEGWALRYGEIDALLYIETYRANNPEALEVVDNRMPLLSTARLYALKAKGVLSQKEMLQVEHTERVREGLEEIFRNYIPERAKTLATKLRAAGIEDAEHEQLAAWLLKNPAEIKKLLPTIDEDLDSETEEEDEDEDASVGSISRSRSVSSSSDPTYDTIDGEDSDSSEDELEGVPSVRDRTWSADSSSSDGDWVSSMLEGEESDADRGAYTVDVEALKGAIDANSVAQQILGNASSADLQGILDILNRN